MKRLMLIAFCGSLTMAAMSVQAAGQDTNDANVTQRGNANVSGSGSATPDRERDVAPNAATRSGQVDDANVRKRDEANTSGASAAAGRDRDAPPSAASSGGENDANVTERDNSNTK